jgi:hypothetical protein
MRNALLGAVGLAVAAGFTDGCFYTYDCTDDETCRPTTTSTSSTGTSSSSGSGGGMPSCNGDPTTDPAIVRDDCGVFVNATAAPGGDGRMATPFQTFAEAAASGQTRVFACAGSYTETMQVAFSGGVEVYGGFTGCMKTWTWSAGASAQISTKVDVPGVVLAGGANKLENVSVTVPAASVSGGSSIALLVSGGSLDMTNGSLTAGDAKDGDPGMTTPADSTLDGSQGANGADTCSAGGTHTGGIGATNMCSGGMTSSTAGTGGDGGDPMGDPAGSGTDGTAVPAATPSGTSDGKGGAGEGAVVCANGDNGAPGATGGSGAGAISGGKVSKNGYTGNAGQDGTSGAPGQGGGGGGGSKGIASGICMGNTVSNLAGSSGGAGGTGGCGGAQGGAGKAGGSSIALLALNAGVTLTSVTLTAGKGGNGGQGGSGQPGGTGGAGGGNGAGGPADDACPGGKGGKGGNGGPGGGGQGGHSLGIAFQGTSAPVGGTFMVDMTKNGTGGLGGNTNTTANGGKGADGVAANCWDFGSNATCK